LHPLAALGDGGLERLTREGQDFGSGQRPEQAGRDDGALRDGQRVEIGGDHAAGGDVGGGQNLGPVGDAVAGDGLFADGKRAVGGGDQRGAVGGDEAADDRCGQPPSARR
jgi:hypothetical protein